MKKKIFSILFAISYLIFAINPVFAQTQSNTVTTKIGNPATGGGSIEQAMHDLFAAYKECSGKKDDKKVTSYSTTESLFPYALKPCLMANLQDKYSETIKAFDTRYGSSKGSGANINGCVECLPYVALIMSLATGETDTFTSNSPTDYYNKQTVISGKLFYDQFTPSAANPLQPGDIGITITAGETSNVNIGHQLMVESFDSNEPALFVGNESNWVPCAVAIIPRHNVSKYHFFRLRK